MEAIKVCVSQNKVNASLKIETASDSCIVGYLSEAVFLRYDVRSKRLFALGIINIVVCDK